MDAERSERARIVALFMGALVEQTIKRIDFGETGPAADVSLTQLRDEFAATIAVLAAEVERIDARMQTGETPDRAECSQRGAVLLTAVLRAWLGGDDPDLVPALSALDRNVAWSVH